MWVGVRVRVDYQGKEKVSGWWEGEGSGDGVHIQNGEEGVAKMEGLIDCVGVMSLIDRGVMEWGSSN